MKILLIIKKYSHIILFLLIFVFSIFFVFLRRKPKNFTEELNEIRRIHDAKIEIISNERAQEKKRQKKIELEYRLKIEELEKRLEEELALLDKKKAKEAKAIIEKYVDDEVGLAVELSRVTGFKVVFPEGDQSESK